MVVILPTPKKKEKLVTLTDKVDIQSTITQAQCADAHQHTKSYLIFAEVCIPTQTLELVF